MFLLLGVNCTLNAKAPNLSYFVPAGIQRGSKTVVTCHGDFDWPLKVWAPGADIQVAEEKGKLTIEVPSELAADRVWIRLYNAEGVSTAIPFLVGSLPETVEIEPNDSPTTAQPLEKIAAPPNDTRITVNGVLQKKGDVDSFAVRLRAGQQLVAAVKANTHFGSPMDAILQVVSPQGTVLAENHDTVGLDPQLAFKCSQTGIHIVRVFAFPAAPNQSIQFHGGASYVYRLTLTTGPFITHTRPQAIFQSAEREQDTSSTSNQAPPTVEAIGWNIPTGTRLPVLPLSWSSPFREFEPGSVAGLRATTGFVRAPDWAGSARLSFVPHPVNEVAAPSEQPATLSIPMTYSGSLREAKQVDSYRFDLTKDQEVQIQIDALKIDSAMVPHARLTNPNGKTVYEVSESGPAKDVSLSHTPTLNGLYTLSIQDRFGHGGQGYDYRLTATLAKADFALSVETDEFTLPHDKPLEVPVSVQRHAGTGLAVKDIRIEVVGLPSGVSCDDVLSLATGETASKVTLQLKSNGQPYSGPIRIRGSETESNVVRFALTPVKYRSCTNTIWLTARTK